MDRDLWLVKEGGYPMGKRYTAQGAIPPDAAERIKALQTYQRRYRQRFGRSCAFLAIPMMTRRPACGRSRSPCWSSLFVHSRRVLITMRATALV